MSPGTSRITRKSKLKPEWREVFLTAKYFREKPDYFKDGLQAFTNYFDEPSNDIEYAIIELLNQEQIDYSDKKIEYWFQHQIAGQSLAPHCDYNHNVREAMPLEEGGKWLHNTDTKYTMSPVTLACYLEAIDLVGGELCISECTWFNHPNPTVIIAGDIEQYPYETYTPVQDDLLHFEGSRYFHWINKVEQGERKSMMINFWPKDI